MSEVHTDKSTGAKHCLGCGYIIDHLPEPRCPECGREFDPNEAATYQIRPMDFRRKIIRQGLFAGSAFLTGASGFALMSILSPMRLSFAAVALHMGTCGCIGVGFLFLSRVAATAYKNLAPSWSAGKSAHKLRLFGLEVLELTFAMTAIFCLGWSLFALLQAVNC
jgi:hypothetical protein